MTSLVEINNGRGVKEIILLLIVFVLCFNGGIIQFVNLLNITTPVNIFIISAAVLFSVIITVIIALRTKKINRIYIDTVNKTFGTNKEMLYPISDIVSYKGSVVGKNRFVILLSTMYIELTMKDGHKIKFNDDDISRSNTDEEFTALQQLIVDSNLSEVEKESFSGWVERCHIKQI